MDGKELDMGVKVSIDSRLIELALEVSGERTRSAAVTRALEEFVARREQRGLRELMRKLEWDPLFEYKKERSRN